ncbi:hypothetical protein ACEPAI_9972 [Sanghuangporus weigelae]
MGNRPLHQLRPGKLTKYSLHSFPVYELIDRMSSDLSHKESIAKTKGQFTAQTEPPIANHDSPQGTTASEEHEVQSLAKESSGDIQNDADKPSGGVSADVRIPIKVEAINPEYVFLRP